MKITVDIDLTPDEARKMMGLPNVEKMQQDMMEKIRDKMLENLEGMTDAEFLFKKVFPLGLQNMEKFQNFFTEMASAATSGKAKKD